MHSLTLCAAELNLGSALAGLTQLTCLNLSFHSLELLPDGALPATIECLRCIMFHPDILTKQVRHPVLCVSAWLESPHTRGVLCLLLL